MKYIPPIFLFAFLLISCGNSTTQKSDESSSGKDSIEVQAPIDTLELTLDALRNKRLREGYKMIGDVKTDILTFTGFEMGDAAYFIFSNSSGKTISFSGNSTNVELIIPMPDSLSESVLPSEVEPVDTGGNMPNPKYLNKKFRVVWRTVQLDRKPQNEIEFYYQEYDEIIYLKPYP